VGSPLVNWLCLTHSSPTSYATKDVCILRMLASGLITAISLTIFKLIETFLQVRLRPCPLAIGHSMANGLLTHSTSVLRPLSFTKTSNLWPETFALSVGVLAFILALPSGSEVRVKKRELLPLSARPTSVHRETASHPCVTSNMVSILIRHSVGTCLLSFKRR
jgi:hypothetical protein